MDSSCGLHGCAISDGQCINTVCLVAVNPMHAVGVFLARIVSRSLGEALQCLQIGRPSPSGVTSENLQGFHTDFDHIGGVSMYYGNEVFPYSLQFL